MIGRLRGQLIAKRPQEITVDVGGVGYRVHVPLSTFYRVGEVGNSVDLLIHTHVREDALTLFGFGTQAEHELFERLIAVSGVGPRLATNILSGIDAAELIAALAAADVARLTTIPGVGKKTAERLVLELRDAMQRQVASDATTLSHAERHKQDLLAALAHLGYSRSEAERAAERVLREKPEAPMEDWLRSALHMLSAR
jgi:Holliday junction DNA helicase RuvA